MYRFKPLFASPEEHAVNTPESWIVEKTDNRREPWGLFTADKEILLGNFSTKKSANQSKIDGEMHQVWMNEKLWYAGEEIPNAHGYLKTSWFDMLERERVKREAKRRQVERMGIPEETFERWSKVVSSTVNATKRVNELNDTVQEMHQVFTENNLLSVDSLNEAEAAEIYVELNEIYGFSSIIENRLNRMKYLGLDNDKTVVEVLEEMLAEEQEAISNARLGLTQNL